jgi:hypothetical protein
MTGMIGFLQEPESSGAAQVLFDEDRAELGYVMNVSRLWAYQPELVTGLFDLMRRASGLEPAERPLAAWARAVAGDPNATHAAQVAALRAAGYADADIFAMTVFVALRVALSTVNDALGIAPDTELAAGLPPDVRRAVTFGRPPDHGGAAAAPTSPGRGPRPR